jgi:hypothetical protein
VKNLRKPKWGVRSICLGVKLPVEEFLALRKAAQRQHMSMSDYVRSFLPDTTVTGLIRNERPHPIQR